jgi:hypothetical protein
LFSAFRIFCSKKSLRIRLFEIFTLHRFSPLLLKREREDFIKEATKEAKEYGSIKKGVIVHRGYVELLAEHERLEQLPNRFRRFQQRQQALLESSFDRGEVLLDRKTTGAAPKVQSDRHDWWGDEQNGGRFVHVSRKRRDRGEVRL